MDDGAGKDGEHGEEGDKQGNETSGKGSLLANSRGAGSKRKSEVLTDTRPTPPVKKIKHETPQRSISAEESEEPEEEDEGEDDT